MKTTRQILYGKVEDARESCAGCHVLEKKDLLKKIKDAIDYAREVEASAEVMSKLLKAKGMVERSEGFDKIRIEADQILADILNTDLEGEG